MGTWRIIAATVAVSVPGLAAMGFTVDLRSLLVALLACFGCETLAVFYRTSRPDPRLSATLTAVAQLLALSAAAGPLSYAVAAGGGPLWDATFAAWDKSLGLDWFGYAVFVDGHPRLAQAGGLAYDSLELQLVLVPLALGFTGRTRALAEFVTAFALAAVAVVLLSGLMPALGAYPGLGIQPGRFPHIVPRDVYDTAAAVADLRRGGARSLSLSDLSGIITFPSFHAAGGVLIAMAMWRVPSLRLPVCALDALMVAATPTHGGHYGVDVLSGAAVAAAAIVAARAVAQREAAGRSSAVAVRAAEILPA